MMDIQEPESRRTPAMYGGIAFASSIALATLCTVVGSAVLNPGSQAGDLVPLDVAARCAAIGASILGVPLALVVAWSAATPDVGKGFARGALALVSGFILLLTAGMLGAAILKPPGVQAVMVFLNATMGMCICVVGPFGAFVLLAFVFFIIISAL